MIIKLVLIRIHTPHVEHVRSAVCRVAYSPKLIHRLSLGIENIAFLMPSDRILVDHVARVWQEAADRRALWNEDIYARLCYLDVESKISSEVIGFNNRGHEMKTMHREVGRLRYIEIYALWSPVCPSILDGQDAATKVA